MSEWIIKYRSNDSVDYETIVETMQELYYTIGIIYNCNGFILSVEHRKV